MPGAYRRRRDAVRRSNKGWSEARAAQIAAAAIAGAAVGFSALPVRAQENEGHLSAVAQSELASVGLTPTVLDRLTVVSRTAEAPIETMASVSQVSGEQLQQHMATTPGDVFFGVPGVIGKADSRRVVSGINIRGLQDFGRVAVILDGARQNFQRSDHGTQSMVFIDPALIKQVDVVRGPVANTYGSGAIGGVVVFETKDADDFLHDDETWAASIYSQYETNGQGWTTSATGAYRFSDAFSVLGNLVYRNYDEYEDGDGNTVDGTAFDVLSGMIKATARPTENSKLQLGWVGADDAWTELSTSTGLPTHDVDLEQNTFTARYSVTDDASSWLDLHVNASYNMVGLTRTYLNDTTEFDSSGLPTVDIPAGSQSTYDLETLGIDIWNTSRFDTGALYHELTYGGDWVSDDVVTERAGGGGMDVYTPSGTRRVSGLYIQDKLTWDWLEVIGGLRYDSYRLESDVGEVSGDRISPRLTVGVSPFTGEVWQGLQFYGTYAEGYRSPSITETLMSGMHPTDVTFPFLPNPNLRPETAKTWEFGINYKRDGVFYPDDGLRLKAAYFRNDIDDYIGSATLSSFDPTSGCPFNPSATIPICVQYQNFPQAKIDGFELEALYDAGRFFGGLSASIINDYHVVGISEDELSIPASQVTGRLGFRFLEDRLTIGGEVQYNDVPSSARFPKDFTLVNLFASYQANEHTQFDLRVENLFDVKYANPLNIDRSGPVVFEPGLSVKFAARVRFGG